MLKPANFYNLKLQQKFKKVKLILNVFLEKQLFFFIYLYLVFFNRVIFATSSTKKKNHICLNFLIQFCNLFHFSLLTSLLNPVSNLYFAGNINMLFLNIFNNIRLKNMRKQLGLLKFSKKKKINKNEKELNVKFKDFYFSKFFKYGRHIHSSFILNGRHKSQLFKKFKNFSFTMVRIFKLKIIFTIFFRLREQFNKKKRFISFLGLIKFKRTLCVNRKFLLTIQKTFYKPKIFGQKYHLKFAVSHTVSTLTSRTLSSGNMIDSSNFLIAQLDKKLTINKKFYALSTSRSIFIRFSKTLGLPLPVRFTKYRKIKRNIYKANCMFKRNKQIFKKLTDIRKEQSKEDAKSDYGFNYKSKHFYVKRPLQKLIISGKKKLGYNIFNNLFLSFSKVYKKPLIKHIEVINHVYRRLFVRATIKNIERNRSALGVRQSCTLLMEPEELTTRVNLFFFDYMASLCRKKNKILRLRKVKDLVFADFFKYSLRDNEKKQSTHLADVFVSIYDAMFVELRFRGVLNHFRERTPDSKPIRRSRSFRSKQTRKMKALQVRVKEGVAKFDAKYFKKIKKGLIKPLKMLRKRKKEYLISLKEPRKFILKQRKIFFRTLKYGLEVVDRKKYKKNKSKINFNLFFFYFFLRYQNKSKKIKLSLIYRSFFKIMLLKSKVENKFINYFKKLVINKKYKKFYNLMLNNSLILKRRLLKARAFKCYIKSLNGKYESQINKLIANKFKIFVLRGRRNKIFYSKKNAKKRKQKFYRSRGRKFRLKVKRRRKQKKPINYNLAIKRLREFKTLKKKNLKQKFRFFYNILLTVRKVSKKKKRAIYYYLKRSYNIKKRKIAHLFLDYHSLKFDKKKKKKTKKKFLPLPKKFRIKRKNRFSRRGLRWILAAAHKARQKRPRYLEKKFITYNIKYIGGLLKIKNELRDIIPDKYKDNFFISNINMFYSRFLKNNRYLNIDSHKDNPRVKIFEFGQELGRDLGKNIVNSIFNESRRKYIPKKKPIKYPNFIKVFNLLNFKSVRKFKSLIKNKDIKRNRSYFKSLKAICRRFFTIKNFFERIGLNYNLKRSLKKYRRYLKKKTLKYLKIFLIIFLKNLKKIYIKIKKNT